MSQSGPLVFKAFGGRWRNRDFAVGEATSRSTQKITGGKLDFTHGRGAQSSESSFYCIGADSLQKICYALNILLL